MPSISSCGVSVSRLLAKTLLAAQLAFHAVDEIVLGFFAVPLLKSVHQGVGFFVSHNCAPSLSFYDTYIIALRY